MLNFHRWYSMPNKEPANHDVMTAQEVSECLRISLSTVHHLSRIGKIKGIKMGKQWRYLREDIEKCLANGFEDVNVPSPVRRSSPWPTIERRIWARMNCNLQGHLTIQSGNQSWEARGMILNLSEGGILFQIEEQDKKGDIEPRHGDNATIAFCLPQGDPYAVRLASGRIIHRSDSSNPSLGIKFRNVPFNLQKEIRQFIG